ncbi:MAG: hypothetical protein J6C07_11670 [Lachnospiraceae bacterium]|nr:hypothetical protein [Lachnospiraceae bacterium]
MTIGQFRENVKVNAKYREECLAYRNSLADRWDYNAVAGILIGSKSRHTGGQLHVLEQNIGIGQGDNGNHVVLKLSEKKLDIVFAKYEKDMNTPLAVVLQEIVSAAPEYEGIIDFITERYVGEKVALNIANTANKFEQTRNSSLTDRGVNCVAETVAPNRSRQDGDILSAIAGKFDVNSKYSCFCVTYIGSGNESEETRCNYVEYCGNLYFMNYKGVVDPNVNNSDRYNIVIGRVSLQSYKVEILKEYSSINWKYTPYNIVRKSNLFSISDGKVWYITYENDDANNGGQSNKLVVKCLDINTKQECKVMDIPSTYSEARFPIVNGNVLTFLANGKLVVYNLSTKKKTAQNAEQIICYGHGYIFFSKDTDNRVSSINVLDVNTAEVKKLVDVMPYLQNSKSSNLYYINSENLDVYIQGTLRKSIYKISRMGSMKEIKGFYNGSNYSLDTHFDGRREDLSFNGKMYVASRKGLTGGRYNADGSEPFDNFLVEIDENGSCLFTKMDVYPDDTCNLVSLSAAGGIVICNIDYNGIVMRHNNKWYRIKNN